MHTRLRRWDALGLAGLALVCALVITFPAPFPGHVVSTNDLVRAFTPFSASDARPRNPLLADPAQVFRPDLSWARGQIRSGHLPTWDPLVFGGWPLLASQQTAALFPLKAPSYVLPYQASVGVDVVLLLAVAALGMFLFARQLGLSRAPSALAGLAFGLSAPMIVWTLHPQSNVHAALPWMMLGTEAAFRGRRWGVPVLGAAVGAAALGGHPESVLLDGLLVVAWAILRLARRMPVREWLGRAGRVTAGAALGLAGGAVVLLPLAELLGQTPVAERGGLPGPRLEALGSLALPDVWGRPDWPFAIDPAGLLNYAERTAYLGAAPLILGAVGFLVYRDATRWFFAAAAAVSVLIAFKVPGVSAWLVARWPLRLAGASREISVLVFSVAMLGALGLQAIVDRPMLLRRPASAAAGLAVAAAPVLWLLDRFHPRAGLGRVLGFLPGLGRPATASQAAAAAGGRWILFAGATIVLLALMLARGGPLPARLLVALVAIDLALGWHGYVPVLSNAQSRLPETASIRTMLADQGDGRSTAGAAIGGPQVLVPDTSEYFGLRDPRGRGVPTLGRTEAAWTALGGAGAANFAFVDPSAPSSARAMRAFGVRDALTVPGAPPPPDATLVHRGADGDVYRLGHTLPRAFVTCSWTPADEATATALLGGASLDRLYRHPFVETGAAPAASCTGHPHAARIVADGATTVRVDVTGRGPGRLILLDTYYPGWQATVDGRRASIEAANVAFRSVAIPAGAHAVVFRYRPASVRDGLVVSVLAWLAIAGLGVFAVVRASGTAAARGRPASSAG